MHLLMAQYVYNGAENKKTKMTLFFSNYGYNSSIQGPSTPDSLSLSALENAKRLSSLHTQLIQDAEFINKTVGRYYDKRHEDIPPWKEGDKVYL